MPTHQRTTDLVPRQNLIVRLWRWWLANSMAVTGLIAVTFALLTWYVSKTGFAIVGPRDALAEVVRQTQADSAIFAKRLDEQSHNLDVVQAHVDSLDRIARYMARAMEAGNRVVCHTEPRAAALSGIICPSGKVAP